MKKNVALQLLRFALCSTALLGGFSSFSSLLWTSMTTISLRWILKRRKNMKSSEGISFDKPFQRKKTNRFFPKQLQLMGFSILAKKQTLLQHDFQVCLLCLPSTGSCFVMISRFVTLCLLSTGSCFVITSRFVTLCLLSTGSCFVMISRFVSLCLPSTGSCFVMISRFVSLCLPSILDLVSSCFPGLSPFVSLLLDPVSS